MSMKLHYYGQLDSLESCYTFQKFEMDGTTLYLQNSTRFGFEPSSMAISNPALFVKKDEEFYRFVIEDYTLNIVDGEIAIGQAELMKIREMAIALLA